MFQKTIQTEPGQWLEITARRNLLLQGSDDQTIIVSVENGLDLDIQVIDKRISIRCEKDCAMTAPASMLLKVLEVRSDMNLTGWQADAIINRVGGDLSIDSVGPLSVGAVGGDCIVGKVAGNFKFDAVGGDLSCQEVRDGTVSGGKVGGDATVTSARSDLSLRAGGDAVVSFSETGLFLSRVQAGGNIMVIIPPSANLDYRTTSGGMKVTVRSGGQVRNVHAGVYEGRIGSGGARIELTAGGDIVIDDSVPVTSEVGAAQAWAYGSSKWEDKLSEKTDRALRKAERKIDQASQKMARGSERAQQAMRRAQERVQAAMQQIGEREAGTDTGVPSSSQPVVDSSASITPESMPQAAAGGVTEEEKLLILQMLQAKKITVDEADRLLAALEGGQQPE